MNNTPLMSRDTRIAGLSFLLSLLIVGAVSVTARLFYQDTKAQAAMAATQTELMASCQ